MNIKNLSFQNTQQQFCDWIRKPENEVPQRFSHERMQIYRDLLFNNICSFINLVYPVARSILPKDKWQGLLEEFFQKSKCQSPFYNDISLQFRDYFIAKQHQILEEYPWLAELLQFEWLELYLDTLVIEDKILTQEPIWQLRMQVWVLVYQYPVYMWTVNTTLAEIKQMPNAVMVWRSANDQVCIENVSPLFAMLIEQLNKKGLSESELSQLICSELPNLSLENIQELLHDLAKLLTQLQLLYIPK